MSITVSVTAVQSHTADVDAAEMSNSRRSPSLISISVGADHTCCRKLHGSLRSFSLTGTIFSSIQQCDFRFDLFFSFSFSCSF